MKYFLEHNLLLGDPIKETIGIELYAGNFPMLAEREIRMVKRYWVCKLHVAERMIGTNTFRQCFPSYNDDELYKAYIEAELSRIDSLLVNSDNHSHYDILAKIHTIIDTLSHYPIDKIITVPDTNVYAELYYKCCFIYGCINREQFLNYSYKIISGNMDLLKHAPSMLTWYYDIVTEITTDFFFPEVQLITNKEINSYDDFDEPKSWLNGLTEEYNPFYRLNTRDISTIISRWPYFIEKFFEGVSINYIQTDTLNIVLESTEKRKE